MSKNDDVPIGFCCTYNGTDQTNSFGSDRYYATMFVKSIVYSSRIRTKVAMLYILYRSTNNPIFRLLMFMSENPTFQTFSDVT